MKRLIENLVEVRHRQFVGRAAETALFQQWLVETPPSFNLLYIFAPGGVGKTTLLREYARLASTTNCPILWIDGRTVTQPSPNGFQRALKQCNPENLPEDLSGCLLLIDTFERLAPLQHWLRENFLPSLTPTCRVVMAGRLPPGPEWQTDLAWRKLTRVLSLRNLTPTESQQLLTHFGIDEAHHESLLSMTHGHPLAMALAADWLVRNEQAEILSLEQAPDVVHRLVECLVQDIPSAAHRRALEACAHVRVTTEALLAELFDPETARELFVWLRSLSFIEHAPDGIFPHDLVRDALEADLRWRNSDRYKDLHHQLRQPIVRRLLHNRGIAQQQAFFDLLHLHRQQPLMKPYYEWSILGSAYAEPAVDSDHADILEMVQRHEGTTSRNIAAYWLQRQPQAFSVFRGGEPQPLGFVAHLLLNDITPEEIGIDPAIRAIWSYTQQHGSLRPGECIHIVRFWMGRENYQTSLIHNLVATTCTLLWQTTPNLAWAFPSAAEPAHWETMFNYLNFRRVPEADFEVSHRRYGVFAHDWRAEPTLTWLETMGERELDMELRAEQLVAPSSPLLVLSQPEFADAVRQALRDYYQRHRMAQNPLLRSRLVRDAEMEDETSRETLQRLLEEALEALQHDPRAEKFHRALVRTYFKPAASQEKAAESLGLPFNTYRYQLAKGQERIIEWLWQRELYGAQISIDAE